MRMPSDESWIPGLLKSMPSDESWNTWDSSKMLMPSDESQKYPRLLREQHASEDPLWQKETTPKLAEAVPVESKGISAFNGWQPHFHRAV